MQLFVVADVKSEDGTLWELRGVYTDETLAVAACELPTDCVMPIEANATAPRETVVVEKSYYPLALGPSREALRAGGCFAYLR